MHGTRDSPHQIHSYCGGAAFARGAEIRLQKPVLPRVHAEPEPQRLQRKNGSTPKLVGKAVL